MTQPLTSEGAIVGTFEYIRRGQLEGKDADARADIWALGCVLYEMATGQRAFAGGSRASLIAAIMDREPRPIAELQPLSPLALQNVVARCLAKDRRPLGTARATSRSACRRSATTERRVCRGRESPAPARPSPAVRAIRGRAWRSWSRSRCSRS